MTWLHFLIQKKNINIFYRINFTNFVKTIEWFIIDTQTLHCTQILAIMVFGPSSCLSLTHVPEPKVQSYIEWARSEASISEKNPDIPRIRDLFQSKSAEFHSESLQQMTVDVDDLVFPLIWVCWNAGMFSSLLLALSCL